MNKKHALTDHTLKAEADGIVAYCICGWKSRPHFSPASASCAFMDHEDGNGDTDAERIANDSKPRRTAATK